MIFIDVKPSFTYVTTDNAVIGAILTDLRIQIGMTQKDMAESIGVAPNQIKRREQGDYTWSREPDKHAWCTDHHLQSMATVFGIQFHVFITLVNLIQHYLGQSGMIIDLTGLTFKELEESLADDKNKLCIKGQRLHRFVCRHVDDYLNTNMISLCH